MSYHVCFYCLYIFDQSSSRYMIIAKKNCRYSQGLMLLWPFAFFCTSSQLTAYSSQININQRNTFTFVICLTSSFGKHHIGIFLHDLSAIARRFLPKQCSFLEETPVHRRHWQENRDHSTEDWPFTLGGIRYLRGLPQPWWEKVFCYKTPIDKWGDPPRRNSDP